MSWEEIKKNIEENNGRYIPTVPKNVAPVKYVENKQETGMNDFLGELFNRGKKLAFNSLKTTVVNQITNPRKSNFIDELKKNAQENFLSYMTGEKEKQETQSNNKENETQQVNNNQKAIQTLSPEKQKELEEKLAQFKNQNATVNQNNKDITKREVDSKLKAPEVQIANKQYEEQKQKGQIESIDKLVNDYKAQEKAKEINERIDKGGADAVNAVIENTLTNFTEGTMGAIGSIANVPLILGSGYADSIKKATNNFSNITNTKKANTDELDNFKNSLLNEANTIGNKYTEYSNANQYIKNDAVRTAGSVSNTIGNMVPSILSNIVLPGSRSICTRIICRRKNSIR